MGGSANDGTSAYTDAGYWRSALGGGVAAQRVVLDPGVNAAIATGDPRRIRPALLKVRNRAEFRDLRSELDVCLDNVRAFEERPVGAPPVGWFIIMSVRLYGRRHHDAADGTYVATRWLTFGRIPLFALDSWVVSDTDKGRNFHARVPFDRTVDRWRVVALAAVMLLAGVGLVSSLRIRFSTDLYVVNGLDIPVTVSYAKESFQVPAQGLAERSIDRGPFELRCTRLDGRLLDHITTDVTDKQEACVYNVLGAEPVYLRTLVYGTGEQESPQPRWLAGTPWTPVGRLDYAFRDPPSEVSLPRNKSVATRALLDTIGGGWREAVQLLVDQDRMDEAAALSARVACAESGRPLVVEEAADQVLTWGASKPARDAVEAWLTDHPDDPDAPMLRALFDPDAATDSTGRPTYRTLLLDELRGAHARRAFRPMAAPRDDPSALSRAGGRPWLPRGERWPTCRRCQAILPLFFQLDLAVLPAGAPHPAGPGLLQVFHCVEPRCNAIDASYLERPQAALLRIVDNSAPGGLLSLDESPEGWESWTLADWEEETDLPSEFEPVLNRYSDVAVTGAYADEDGRSRFPLWGDKLGGWPFHFGPPTLPACPVCGIGMQVFLQLRSPESSPHLWGGRGCAYVHMCACRPDALELTWPRDE